jgi:DNA-nicking Smr family endonuclease
MSPRRVRPDELELWQQVTAKAERLDPRKTAFETPLLVSRSQEKNTSVATPKNWPTELLGTPRVAAFKIGQSVGTKEARSSTLSAITNSYPVAALQMDQKAFTRLRRGKLAPEARIDLHGMTLQQAHPELIGFILRTHAADHRLVLVITGKGKPGLDVDIIPRRTGVLKHKVPQWLRLAPVSSCVLEIAEAHLKHGGGGAFYVYLRRKR